MKFDKWLQQQGISAATVAPKIKVGVRTAYRYADGSRIPDRQTMKRIFKITGGEVSANDFYDIK